MDLSKDGILSLASRPNGAAPDRPQVMMVAPFRNRWTRLCQNGHRAKLQAWQPREIPGRVAVADIHHEVDLDRCVREEATILATLSRDMLKCCCLPLRHPFGSS